jgi:hypothetical protein
METSRIQTETQRGKHRPSMVLLAGVSAALLAGAVAFDRAGSSGDVETSPGASVTATTAPMPMEELVMRAADKAALVQLCLDGLGDPEAAAYYQQARAAHPDLAEGIGPDCQLVQGPARVAGGRAGIALR